CSSMLTADQSESLRPIFYQSDYLIRTACKRNTNLAGFSSLSKPTNNQSRRIELCLTCESTFHAKAFKPRTGVTPTPSGIEMAPIFSFRRVIVKQKTIAVLMAEIALIAFGVSL